MQLREMGGLFLGITPAQDDPRRTDSLSMWSLLFLTQEFKMAQAHEYYRQDHVLQLQSHLTQLRWGEVQQVFKSVHGVKVRGILVDTKKGNHKVPFSNSRVRLTFFRGKSEPLRLAHLDMQPSHPLE